MLESGAPGVVQPSAKVLLPSITKVVVDIKVVARVSKAVHHRLYNTIIATEASKVFMRT
jgi:hypothetical protein